MATIIQQAPSALLELAVKTVISWGKSALSLLRGSSQNKSLMLNGAKDARFQVLLAFSKRAFLKSDNTCQQNFLYWVNRLNPPQPEVQSPRNISIQLCGIEEIL